MRRDANRKNSIHIGIAERYDLVVPEAGGPRHHAGDYIHFNGRSSKFSEGGLGHSSASTTRNRPI